MQLSKEERIALRDELFNIFKGLSLIITTSRGNALLKRKMASNLKDKIFLEKYNVYIEQFRSEEEALYCLSHLDDISKHICPVCGNFCNFYIAQLKYRITCNNKQCNNELCHSEIARKKTIETNLKKRGVQYPTQSKEVRDKVKETNLKRYGVECPLLNEEVKIKTKETNLKKFGVELATQSKEVREKVKQTNLERYGVESPTKLPEIKEKIKRINLERYGCECSLQNKEVKEKATKTNLERYGVKNVAQSKEIYNKVKSTNLSRYGVEISSKCEEVKTKMRRTYQLKYGISDPINNEELCKLINIIRENTRQYSLELCDIYSKNEYFIMLIETMYKLKDRKLRLNELAEIFNIFPQSVKARLLQLNLLEYFFIRDIDLEVQFKEFLEINNISYIRHNRSILHPQEIDFMLCDDSVGIEINDLHTHNIKQKDQNYHLNKTIRAQEKGVRLIHLWEWELTNESLWNKISNWIVNICNTNKTRIFARKCFIKEVSLKEEKNFLNEYHLQGYKKSQVCLGLYYNDELIELMSFCKPRYNKNYQWELLRLCTRYGYNVIGGAQKLLKYFIKNYNPSSIISYCDLSKFTGKIYEDLGFTLSKAIQPQATWYNEQTGKHFTQASLNMIGADKLLGTDFGKGTSNEEIAYMNGYEKVYNCGLAVYTLYNKDLDNNQ